MRDLRDENDDDSDDNFDDYQIRARRSLIDSTRNNVKKNLEEHQMAKRDVFIVSSNVIFSLVTGKEHKKTTPAIDEARLMEDILTMAHARRYGNQAPAIENHSTIVKDNLFTPSLALTWPGYDSEYGNHAPAIENDSTIVEDDLFTTRNASSLALTWPGYDLEYDNHAPAIENHSTIVEDDLFTAWNAYPLALTWYGHDSE